MKEQFKLESLLSEEKKCIESIHSRPEYLFVNERNYRESHSQDD